MRRLFFGWTLAIVALLVIVTPAQAGGWAVVTLDALPRDVHAGQTLQLGFMVRQHGHTPNSNVEPTLDATNAAAGETLQIKATQHGPVGHFVVDVSFPSEGTWEWSITPAPFQGTTFAPLTMLPAAASTSQSDAVTLLQPSMLRWAGLALLILAAALALWARRGAGVRRALPHAR